MSKPVSVANPRPPLASVALISATALAYEILLLRLFALAQWHHFAYMVISLALLGYGVSGTVMALTQQRLLARFERTFVTAILLFGISAVGCALIVQGIPFNPEEVLWDLRQPQRLLLIYVLLALPFFCAASAVALALARYRDDIPRLYAADLLGAGSGSLFILVMLSLLFPLPALGTIGVCAMLAVLLAVWELRLARPWLWGSVAVLGAGVLWLLATHSTLNLSPYKPLSQLLRVPGAQIIAEHSSPLGLLSVVESPQVPLRHAPGLSLNAQTGPPPQLAVFTDGDGMSVITDGNRPATDYAYLDQFTAALPYHLTQPRNVLILGAGGGSEVLQARWQGATKITAVELNPQLAALVTTQFGDFAGHLYQQPGVILQVTEARGFIATDTARYDLITLAFLDTRGAAAAGLHALHEDYLYTVESFAHLLARLAPDGWLALTRWIDLPPRDLLKLAATAAMALEQRGAADPAAQVMLIRGWQTGTLLIKNGVITPEEVTHARHFAAARSFDLDWAPGLEVHEVNRYNQLAEPYFYTALQALLGPQRATYLAQYKFDLQPARDDRPYFYHFARPGTLPELLQLRGRGGMPLIEWGYLVLIATLVQALLASAVLILLPLWVLRRTVQPRGQTWRVAGYFSAIGLAFLFIEIVCIQRFTLLLHHPVYAAATVLGGFLVFAGFGSAYAGRLARAGQHARGVRAAVAVIAALVLFYLATLGSIFTALMPYPLWARVIASILLIMPLAFAMGLPFSLGLARVAQITPQLIPWAWGVNGCASVISAVLATLLAVHWGFSVVMLAAVTLYGLASLWLPAHAPDPRHL
ncbi:MAG TPA: SAM-dependent methyltransferase [Gammaproteobacteria bacterium]|nr:SAM-dependent methyltransferase [Gammaproteobacteria bacterium]